MRVFVAGGTGTIGVPLVRALVARNHLVFATTRSSDKQSLIRGLGATPVVVDALDAAALEKAVREAAPTHVVHELTALPKAGPRSAQELEPTNRLRDEGTRNLLRAAIAASAQRIVVGSFAMLGATVDRTAGGDLDRAAAAVRFMESQVIDAAHRGEIEAIVLRYGLFYGPGNPATDELIARVRKRRLLPRVRDDRGQLPYIHLDDAVAATIAALDHGTSGRVYNIVDDRPSSFSEMVTELADVAGAPPPWTLPAWLLRMAAPYLARLFTLQVRLSNAQAREELGWAPMFPSYREGLRQTIRKAA